MGDRCTNFCPPEWEGPWRDWHRGHCCNLDPDNVTVLRGFLDRYDVEFPADGGEPTIMDAQQEGGS